MLPTTQQPNEGARQFSMFRTYLELGPNRTHAKVCRKHGKSIGYVQEIAAKWKWTERIAAHAVELAETQRRAEEQAALEVAREILRRKQVVKDNAWATYEEMIFVARKHLRLPEAGQKPVDAARLLQVAEALGRIGADMPLRTELTGKDGAPLNSSLPAPIINVIYQRDEKSQAIRDKYFHVEPDDE